SLPSNPGGVDQELGMHPATNSPNPTHPGRQAAADAAAEADELTEASLDGGAVTIQGRPERIDLPRRLQHLDGPQPIRRLVMVTQAAVRLGARAQQLMAMLATVIK